MVEPTVEAVVNEYPVKVESPQPTCPPSPPASPVKKCKVIEQCCPMPPPLRRCPILEPEGTVLDVRDLSATLFGTFALGAAVALALAYFSRTKVTDA